MPFGLSLGKNKQKIDQTTIGSGTETTNQTGTTNQQQTEVGSSTTTGSTTTTTTGGTRGQQSGTTATTTTGTESQQGRTSLYSDAVLAALESAGLGSLGRVASAQPVDTSELNFDSNQFITDAVTRATAAATMSRNQAQGGLYDAIGGTARGNTMAALLDQQLANQEAASIAGARNEATSTAAGIERDNIAAELGVRGQDQGFASQILQLLRGGVTTNEQAGQQTQQQAGESQNISEEVQNQSSAQQSEQQTNTVNSLLSVIQQLIAGTTSTTSNESTKGTTSSKGGGFSLGL